MARIVALVAALSLWQTPGLAQASAPQRDCRAMQVPVTVPGVPGASLYGELCVRDGRKPTTVQLLVHGGTYDHTYFDWPQQPDTYSYVDKALEAGYATFNVDRLGSGKSTHPPSFEVTLQNGAEALHDVITQLRSGEIGGHAFSRVYWVGHSYGTVYAWIEASMYQDVDAFVLTGMLHSARPLWEATAVTKLYPAPLDPKFADSGLDVGYLTTMPETRDDLFYYTPAADPAVIALDENLKDTLTTTELQQGLPLVNLPLPQMAPSRAITVPTLLVSGDHDNLACGPPDGLDCTAANVKAQEAPYYSPQANLKVTVIADSGHDIRLHARAPEAADRILNWFADQEIGA